MASNNKSDIKVAQKTDDKKCDCTVCAKIYERYQKVHPIFATVVFIIVIATGFAVLAAFIKTQHNDIANLKTQVSELQSAMEVNDIRENGVTYEGKDGKTALELLKKLHKIETEDYAGMGEFVTAIGGVKSDSNNFWAFYVDGEMAMEGAGDYKTKNGEKIEWRLEEIQF